MGVTEATGKVGHAVINESTAASNEIVAAVPGKKIRVLNFNVLCTDATILTWQSDSTAISGPKSWPAQGGESPGFDPCGHFDTDSGEALNLLSGSAVQVSGSVTYQIID